MQPIVAHLGKYVLTSIFVSILVGKVFQCIIASMAVEKRVVTWMRHAKSKFNETGHIGGVTDVPLTVEGEEQAREAGKALNISPNAVVWTSPLVRASRTGQ